MTEIEIRPGHHVLVCGATQSGKSTLTRAMFYGYSRLVVIDPKHEEVVPRSLVAYTPGDFARIYPQRSTRVVFRPDPDDERHGDVDQVIRRVLSYRRCRLVLHETVDYAKVGWILPALRRALKLGSGDALQVGVTALAQRPVGLNNDVISEAYHVITFRLSLEDDRAKLAGVGGPGFLVPVAQPYGFLWGGPAAGGEVVACPPLRVPVSPTDPTQPVGGGAQWSGRRSATSPS